MISEYLVTIEEKEKKEILLLKERIRALNELYLGFENIDLKKREMLLQEMKQCATDTQKSMDFWWDTIKEKYNLKKDEKGMLILDFKTNDIFLEY